MQTLTPRFTAFLRELVTQRPVHLAALGVAGFMSKSRGIGTTDLQANCVRYGDEDFDRAVALLGPQAPQSSKAPSAPPRDPAARAAPASSPGMRQIYPSMVANARERKMRSDLRSHLVAAKPIVRPSKTAAREPAHFLSLDWRETSKWSAEVIVLCQRLETLIVVERLNWLHAYLKGRRAVAVYAGGVGMYRSFTTRQFLQSIELPSVCVFDFDPRAIVLASQFPRVEAFCAPPTFDPIREAVLPASAPALIRRHLPLLDSLVNPALQAAWQRMKEVGKVYSTLDYRV